MELAKPAHLTTEEHAPAQPGLLAHPSAKYGLMGWLTTVDHKKIGFLYGLFALIFFLVGGFEALLIRTQLMVPNNDFLTAQQYNIMFTMHGTTMIFLAVMPLSAAFFNFIMPLQIGARDVAFPRLNAFSLWTFVAGAIILNIGWFGPILDKIVGGQHTAPDAGWYGYSPLTSKVFSPSHAVDYWIMGLQLLGVASIAASLNFIVTIINMRAPGMTMMRLPVFTWMTLFTAFLIVLSFPFITIALVEVMMDRNFGTSFFEVSGGGMPILWQHLFWVFGHPEVYILILPAMGIIFGNPPDLLAQAPLRLPDRRVLGRVHRLPRLRRVEPPYVHHRHGHGGDRGLCARDDGDRRPDRRENLQLDRHALGRPHHDAPRP